MSRRCRRAPKCGRRWCASCAPARCRRPGARGPIRRPTTRSASWLETALDRAAATQPDPGRTETFHRLNRAEYPNAIRDLLALDVDVSRAAAGRRCRRAGLRQHRRRAVGLAGAARALHVGGAEDQPAGGRAADRAPVDRDLHGAADSSLQDDRMSEDLPFGSRGGMAVRHQLPGRRRVHDQDPAAAQLRRLHPRPRRAAAARGAARRRARSSSSRSAARRQGRPAPASFAGNIFGDSGVGAVHARTPTRASRSASRRRPARASSACRFPTRAVGARRRAAAAADRLRAGHRRDAGRERRRSTRSTIGGPYERDGPGRHAEPPANLRLPAGRRRRRGRGVREADSVDARAPRLPPSGRRRRTIADADGVLQGRPAASGGFEPASRSRSSACSSLPISCSAIERDPADAAPGHAYRLSDLELASRLSFFLWSSIPDDELLDLRRTRTSCRSRRCSSSRCGACWPIRASQRAGRQLRRPVAASCATSASVAARSRTLFPEFDENLREAFQRETELFVESQLARGSQRRRAADAPTTPSSTSGWRGTTASRTSTAATSGG